MHKQHELSILGFLSGKMSLRRGGRFYILAVWQNAPHLVTLKRTQRSSAWLWCFMFGFRSHSVMWKIFCTSEVLRTAMKQFGFGGTVLAQCLQTFVTVHSSVHKHFNQERHFY